MSHPTNCQCIHCQNNGSAVMVPREGVVSLAGLPESHALKKERQTS